MRAVQVIPFGEVIKIFVLFATAQKRPVSFDHTTDCHELSAEVRDVQLMPSGEVITRLPETVPLEATAQNRPFSGDHMTDCQFLSAAEVRDVQVIPLGEVITLPPTEVETAQKRPNCGDHVTEVHCIEYFLLN